LRTILAIVLAGLLAPAVPAAGGELSPGLERLLAATAPAAPVRVLVVMREQADLAALDADLRAAKAGRRDRHRRVVETLQATAARGQAGLAADLAAAKAGGRVLGAAPHWLVSSFVVTATPEVIREIARRPDVERIEADLVIELVEPFAADEPPVLDKSAGVGLVPGVAAVGAPRVWRELGIDGTGVVVGILDTGVDGTHPALAGNWRGRYAPAEECWFDGAGLGDATPIDRHYHGTHVMGTVAGLAPGDTIGVAPGALWIAANVVNNPSGQEAFDNAVIASLEFMTDPDGDPATGDDVPVVVHNSWGVSEIFGDYLGCDSRWWDAIDAVETAGIVLTWAAGNEGPTAGTVRSPANRASTALNAFSVGSTALREPFAVSRFSSRGPSDCGGVFAVKPEVAAPGETILSARPGGGYQVLSGTSMAGPHVAGIVALMRAASPDADVVSIKQALIDTARDLGAVGDDNDTGAGLVDAWAAVTAVMAGVGEVTGTVRDAAGGQPVAGAEVRLDGSWFRTVTGPDGAFRLVLPAGPASFTATAFGYEPGRIDLEVPDGGAVGGDIVLVLRPLTTVSGRVTDPEGLPVAAATVTAEDTPLPPAATGADGRYALDVPAGADLVYGLRAAGPGFGSAFRSVTAGGPVTVDFMLPPRAIEDFESGGFGAMPWRHEGDAPWTIEEGGAWQGSFSARSGGVGHLGLSRLAMDIDVLEEADVVFRVRVSSEERYDALRFYVDGVLRASWSGERAWSTEAFALAAGPRRLTWSWEKDGSVSAGEDAAWLDVIEFPAQAETPRPVLAADREELASALAPGDAGTAEIVITNTGNADLHLAVGVGAPPLPAAAAAVPTAAPAKGAADLRAAVPRTAESGGPDGFGHAWRSSSHPFGPEFAWPDLGAAAAALALDDDDVSGPLDLGFAFPFYGQSFTEVHVGSNGYLAFAADEPVWTNGGLPDGLPPAGMIAPLWDDLAPDLGGTVEAAALGDRFVVRFTDVPHYGAPSVRESFAAVLLPDGAIEFHYLSVGADAGGTVGIESPAEDDGLLVAFNAAGALADSLAIRFESVEPPSWLAVDPAAAVVPPGGSVTVTASLDAAGLAAGLHRSFLEIAGDDPDRPLVTVPVALTVGGSGPEGPPPPRVTFAGAVPNPFNPGTDLHFALPAPGRVELDLYDLAGRRVRRLLAGEFPAGGHVAAWDGRDDRGRRLASGTYLARLSVDGQVQTRAMTLLR
jgi:subtilisin family serine protease